MTSSNRYALVIGNNSYTQLTALDRAVADATAIARVLKETGVTVELKCNATRKEILEGRSRLSKLIGRGKEGIFWFAGHGMQLNKSNYLLPVDAKIEDEYDALDEGVELDVLIERLQAFQPRTLIIVIDACRTSPFRNERYRMLGVPGLAPLKPTSRSNVLVIYSANSDQVAIDHFGPGDTNPHGLFTRKMLPLLQQPLEIRALLREARSAVSSDALHFASRDQQPVYFDNLEDDFYLQHPESAKERTAYDAVTRSAEPLVSGITPTFSFKDAERIVDSLFIDDEISKLAPKASQPERAAAFHDCWINDPAWWVDKAKNVLWELLQGGWGSTTITTSLLQDGFRRFTCYQIGPTMAEAIVDHLRHLGYLKLPHGLIDTKNEETFFVLGITAPATMSDEVQFSFVSDWANRANFAEAAVAQFTLAEMYRVGRGTQADMRQATAWYEKAAEIGYVEAQFQLAELYAKGEIGAPDQTRAFNLYLRAANQGHWRAQVSVAVMYKLGYGTRKNDTEALVWHATRKARRRQQS